eukprot:gene16408-18724_t
MLSFIFLADGPCSESSWRVNDDKGQWWSRRDALVRIVSASVWQSPSVANDFVGDSCFLFGDQSMTKEVSQGSSGSVAEFCRPVVVHNASNLAKAVPVPTEKNLMKLWKEGFASAEKSNAEVGIGRWPLAKSSGVLCSFYPWKELLLATPTATGGTSKSLAKNFDHSKLDKRELLKLLQQSCPVDFLRQHGLNGSEALILKKKNREAISTAYEAWLSEVTKTSAAVRSEDTTEAPTMLHTVGKSASYDKLLSTCVVLLKGILCRAYQNNNITKSDNSGPIGTLLLLHEDYPHELPVFSETSIDRTTRGLPVVCAMGAVRDASDEEVCALIEAALSLNMRCVGANLGRTAEFTSKIVAALVSHAREYRLHAAVSALPAITTVERGGAASSGVTKLAPQRAGAWSWDGASNKLSKENAHSISGKRKHSTMECPTASDDRKSSRSNETNDVSSASAVAVPESTMQHHMHIVAWLHLDVSAVTDDLDQRESMLGLVQLIVTSLWRSRLASEAAHEQHAQDGAGSTEKKAQPLEHGTGAVPKVVPVLHLVFKDGRVATLTQARLAIAMANQHMAAPSEYQVLQTLLACLKDPAVLVTLPAASSGVVGDVSAVLAHVLPADLRKSGRKVVRVVELTDTAPVSHVAVRTTFGGKAIFNKSTSQSIATALASVQSNSLVDGKDNSVISLAECGYTGKCGCGGGTTVQPSDVHLVLLLNRVLKKSSSSGDANQATDEKKNLDSIMSSLYRYVYPDKEIPVESTKVQKKMREMVYHGPLFSSDANTTLTSPSIAVTILQHFAYHDRLYAAIESAVAKHSE